jgi:hypothetical protein
MLGFAVKNRTADGDRPHMGQDRTGEGGHLYVDLKAIYPY